MQDFVHQPYGPYLKPVNPPTSNAKILSSRWCVESDSVNLITAAPAPKRSKATPSFF